MILLDTNVLLYAFGDDHPLRSRCRRLLDAHTAGQVEAATTVEVLQEFAHVHAKRRPRHRAATLARLSAEMLTVVATSEHELDHGLELFVEYRNLDAFDTVLVAVALHHDAPLVSADRAFARVPDLRYVDPATEALDALLATNS